jgi:hypothetical protein
MSAFAAMSSIAWRPFAGEMRSMPSLTRKQSKTPPAPSLQRLDGCMARWFGPRDTAPASVRAEIDRKVGGRYHKRLQKVQTARQHQGGGAGSPARVQLDLALDAGAPFARQPHAHPWRAGHLLTPLHEQVFEFLTL